MFYILIFLATSFPSYHSVNESVVVIRKIEILSEQQRNVPNQFSRISRLADSDVLKSGKVNAKIDSSFMIIDTCIKARADVECHVSFFQYGYIGDETFALRPDPIKYNSFSYRVDYSAAHFITFNNHKKYFTCFLYSKYEEKFLPMVRVHYEARESD